MGRFGENYSDNYDLIGINIILGGASGGKSTQQGVSLVNPQVDPGKKRIELKTEFRVKAAFKEEIEIPIRVKSNFRQKLEQKLHVKSTFSSLMESHKIPITATFKEYMAKRLEVKSKFKEAVKGRIKVEWSENIQDLHSIVQKCQDYKIKRLERAAGIMPRYETFELDLTAFTHSSSFVGNVRYDNDTGDMRILLNGKAYDFCGVPRRVFDGFKGSNSKGNYFALNIRGQYNC